MRDNRQFSNRKVNVWDVLTDFNYNPASFESWLKLMCQVTVLGGAIVLVKALDGRTCGNGWNWWLPQTWGNPAGCFVRSLVRNVPDNFLDDRNRELPPEEPANLIQPTVTPTPYYSYPRNSR